mmetsp:Transcript_22847/g.71021  ORF Transcript_22847/g.71021 Transcript_22847/m.71021 type:complete len:304 (-) Transcript_22847:150-1061(-)
MARSSEIDSSRNLPYKPIYDPDVTRRLQLLPRPLPIRPPRPHLPPSLLRQCAEVFLEEWPGGRGPAGYCQRLLQGPDAEGAHVHGGAVALVEVPALWGAEHHPVLVRHVDHPERGSPRLLWQPPREQVAGEGVGAASPHLLRLHARGVDVARGPEAVDRAEVAAAAEHLDVVVVARLQRGLHPEGGDERGHPDEVTIPLPAERIRLDHVRDVGSLRGIEVEVSSVPERRGPGIDCLVRPAVDDKGAGGVAFDAPEYLRGPERGDPQGPAVRRGGPTHGPLVVRLVTPHSLVLWEAVPIAIEAL